MFGEPVSQPPARIEPTSVSTSTSSTKDPNICWLNIYIYIYIYINICRLNIQMMSNT